MRVRVFLLLTAIFITALVGGCDSPSPRGTASQLADLVFHLECKTANHSTLETDVERFLNSQGFRVFNKTRAQRDHGIDPLQRLWIEGLDEQRRMVLVMSFQDTPADYMIGLYTPPPTHRASALEAALLAFASDQPECVVSRVQRFENGEDARSVHDRSVERLRD